MTSMNTQQQWFQALTQYQPETGLLATASRQHSQIQIRLDNITGHAVTLKEWLLFDGVVASPETPIYGEGFQMLAQSAGVWGQPLAIGHWPLAVARMLRFTALPPMRATIRSTTCCSTGSRSSGFCWGLPVVIALAVSSDSIQTDAYRS